MHHLSGSQVSRYVLARFGVRIVSRILKFNLFVVQQYPGIMWENIDSL